MKDLEEIISYVVIAICVLAMPPVLFAIMMGLADSSNNGNAGSAFGGAGVIFLYIPLLLVLIVVFLVYRILKNREIREQLINIPPQKASQTFVVGIIIMCCIVAFLYCIHAMILIGLFAIIYIPVLIVRHCFLKKP